jgi:5-methylcytosine-specific restriction endonuclease McrA
MAERFCRIDIMKFLVFVFFKNNGGFDFNLPTKKADDSISTNELGTRYSLSLKGRVLILNQSFEPLTVCSAKKATLLLYLLKAEIVSKRDGLLIRSVNHSMPYPSVIRLVSYIRIPYRRIELSRRNIHYRDNFCCQYCGVKTKELTIDHVIPKSRGGDDSWENLVSACKKCNNKKANRTPNEANMHLIKKPYKPNHIMFIRRYLNNVNEDWKPFLFM